MKPCAILLLMLLVGVTPADEKPPAAKLPVGKETTFVTGPIDKNGYIDFETALNERLSKGITPEKNTNVLLWAAFGPTPGGNNKPPAEYFNRLGMKEPPVGADYFIDLRAYMKDVLKVEPDDFNIVYDRQDRAIKRPWIAKDFPDIAAWLKANEKPLVVVVEATKRTQYYNPLVSHRNGDEPTWLIGALLPSVQSCRELANALAARAMLKLGDGKQQEAWADLIAGHRLARHLSHGATLIESLVAVAIGQVAHNATAAYLERADLTSKQLLDRLKELQDLPPAVPMADKIDLGERFVFLDSLQNIRRGGGADGANKKPTAEELKGLDMIDWEPALRNGNKSYDRMAAAMRLPDRTAREKEFDAIEKDLNAVVKKNRDFAELQKLIKNGAPNKEVGKQIGKEIGDVLIALLTPAVRKVQHSQDRARQVERNLQVAFALAAFHKDNGRYPAKLADLAPKYLATAPNDLFTGKDLIYKPNEKGYLFYSVGVNGKDDEGRWYSDEPPGDDPGVRMPLPALKLLK